MRITRPALAVLLGIIIILGSVHSLSRDEVTCGGNTMQYGDKCEETWQGRSQTNSRDTQKANDTVGDWLMIGVGVLVLVCGAYVLVSRVRRRADSNA